MKDKKRGSEEIKEGRENRTGRERQVIATQTAKGRKVTRRVADNFVGLLDPLGPIGWIHCSAFWNSRLGV